jgi:hypothetical protein
MPKLGNAQLRATVETRLNPSISNLRSAAYLTKLCYPLERDWVWPANEEILTSHGAFSTSAVILCVSSLEAYAIEIHDNAQRRTEILLGSLYPAAEKIDRLW